MELFIDNKSGAPIYEQICEQVRAQIVSGALKEDEPLPSIRALAKDLRISVITTKRAYDELLQAGYVYAVAGKGYFVAPRNVELLREENLRRIEAHLTEVAKLAASCDLTREEDVYKRQGRHLRGRLFEGVKLRRRQPLCQALVHPPQAFPHPLVHFDGLLCGDEALQPPVAFHAVAADQTVALHLLEHARHRGAADAKHTLHVALIHRPFLALDQYVVQRVALDARQSQRCLLYTSRFLHLTHPPEGPWPSWSW